MSRGEETIITHLLRTRSPSVYQEDGVTSPWGSPKFRQQGCPEESWGTGLCFEGDPLISRGLGLQGGHL